MSGGDYTLTPNLGLYKPNYALDVGQWGNHLNLNADILDDAVAGGAGGPFLPLADAGKSNLNITSVNTQPTTDYIHNQLFSTVNYTANGTGGDTLGLVSYVSVQANGFSVPGVASQHTSAIYGNGLLATTGTVYQINGIMAITGNNAAGTLIMGVDYFGHQNFNSSGGTITNHYFLYQEQSSAATHEYGAYFSAPIGIGTDAPTWNLHVPGTTGNFSATNWMSVGAGFGVFTVTSNGASFFPGYNPGAGGLGVQDLVVGNNGAAEPTTSTGAFLYISSCPGAPTGFPAQGAIGRCAMRYDTTAHKLWIHDGSTWRGVALA